MSDNTEGTGTVSTKPPAFTVELLFTVLALLAQGFMTVELFAPDSVAGKLVSVFGIVLTGLGYSVARARAVKSVLPTAILVLLVAALLASCTSGQRAGAGRVAGGFIDCMTPTAKEATGELLPAFADIIRNATSPDGSVDTERIENIGKGLIAPATQCAFTTAIKEAIRPRASDPNAPQSSELAPNAALLAHSYERVRASWGGPTFRLEGD